VDAGKTSLTERLLYDTGVIDRLGSVEAGTTQTDTGDLERRRGITIRSAVATFTVGDRQVNLVDTPGHSDFVAEVERALGVLDGALLADVVDGVTPPPRRLRAALRAQTATASVYPLVFGCALSGAGVAALLDGIRDLLPPSPAPEERLRGRVFAIERGPGGA